MKGEPMDLRLDIERRKKYSTHERDYDRGRDMEDSPDSSRARSLEKFSKCHEKSKYVQLPGTLYCFKPFTNMLNTAVQLLCMKISWA